MFAQKFFLLTALSSLIPAATTAQELGMLAGLSSSVLDQGKAAISELPKQLDGMMNSPDEARRFSTAEECLGRLQAAVSAGSVVANLMPFSSVATRDDPPSAEFRLMLNGERHHVVAHCDGASLKLEPHDWSDVLPGYTLRDVSSLDAALGSILLLQLQGKSPETAEVATPEKPAALPEVPKVTDDTMASALAGSGPNQSLRPSAPSQSPEMSGLGMTVQPCWNVGALSTEAQQVTVTVDFSLTADGRPIDSSIKMAGHANGSQAAAQQAFEAARRAILRCGAGGLPLPSEEFGSRTDLQMTFDAATMRVR